MKLNSLTTFSFLASMALGVTACHQDAGMNPTEGTDLDLRDGMAALSFRTGFPNATPVKKVRYVITPVDDSSVEEIDVVVDLSHNLALPGGIPEFENRPLDKESRHRFTDLFQKVKPGRYTVTVFPLDGAGNPVEQCAGASSYAPMNAVAGMVTEKFLMMNCRGQDPAYLDVIAAINHEPELEVDFVRETELTHSKFTCENELEICLTARDIDNDPLRFELTSSNNACQIDVSLAPTQNPPADPCSEIKQCYTVKCPGFVGRADLKARVYDQVWSGDVKIDIEEWLKGNSQISGAPIESHAGLDFWGYYMDGNDDQCKPCPDCDVPLVVDFSYVLLQDLSDSIRGELPAIQNDIQNLVMDLKADTTKLLNDECPLPNQPWVAEPNGGVASFIDRPKLPFGKPGAPESADYVFQVHQPSTANPVSAMTIANVFQSLETRNGADNAEGQLQALLAMLGDYSEDKRTGGTKDDFYLPINDSNLNFAILVTKSPYHQSPDCANKAEVASERCNIKNDNSPALGAMEEYPVMTEVAAELKKDKILPIFLVVKEQGTYQTAPYQAIVDEIGDGLVISYDPNGADIRAEITRYMKKKIAEKNSDCPVI